MPATSPALALCAALVFLPMRYDAVPTDLVGAWTGSAEIVVNWTTQRKLQVHLVIDSAGRVNGTIGDAELVDARVKRNRGALLRALNWKTDWIVIGRLEGPIIAAESIQRERVTVPFNLVKGEIRGGIHTSGSELGRRESGRLSAGRMVLRPVTP